MAASALRAEGLESSVRRRAYALALRLRQVEEELAEASAHADQVRGAQKALLSGLNHELRTPLNAITGFAGLLRENSEIEVSAEKREEYIEHILYSAGVLLERIDAILEAANKSIAEVENTAEPEEHVVPVDADEASNQEPQGGDVAAVVKRLIREFHGRLFVTEVVIDQDLPRSILSDDDVNNYLSALFSLIARKGRAAQSIGVRLKSSMADRGRIVVLELLLPRGTDQPTHDELRQLHLGEPTALIAIETYRPSDGRMTLRLNIPTRHEDSSP